jgi:transcriptional regulator with XRE-family HTH domain
MPQHYPSNDSVALRQHFSTKIKQLLQQHGLSQTALAEKLNGSRNSVSEYTKGEALPSPDRLAKIAKIFKIEPEELMPVSTKTSIPTMNMKVEDDGRVFLQINKRMSFKTATSIMNLVSEEIED